MVECIVSDHYLQNIVQDISVVDFTIVHLVEQGELVIFKFLLRVLTWNQRHL